MGNLSFVSICLGIVVARIVWRTFFKEKHDKEKWNEIIETMKMEVNRTEINRLLKIEKHDKIIDGMKRAEYILFNENHAICQVNSEVLDTLLYEEGCENLINCAIVYKNILCNDKIIGNELDLYRMFYINKYEYMISNSYDWIEELRWIESITYYQGDVIYQNPESDSLKIECAKHKLRDVVKCIKKINSL
jgi:hypothetical protein